MPNVCLKEIDVLFSYICLVALILAGKQYPQINLIQLLCLRSK